MGRRKRGRPRMSNRLRTVRSELVTVRLTRVERYAGEAIAAQRGDGSTIADVLREPLTRIVEEERRAWEESQLGHAAAPE